MNFVKLFFFKFLKFYCKYIFYKFLGEFTSVIEYNRQLMSEMIKYSIWNILVSVISSCHEVSELDWLRSLVHLLLIDT